MLLNLFRQQYQHVKASQNYQYTALCNPALGASFSRGSSEETSFHCKLAPGAGSFHRKSVLSFLINKSVRLRIRTDSSVYKAISARRGVGKIKHIQVKSLWLQNVIKAGEAFIQKIGTKENRADLGTKVLSAADSERLMEMNSIYDKENFAMKTVQKVGSLVKQNSERGWEDPPRRREWEDPPHRCTERAWEDPPRRREWEDPSRRCTGGCAVCATTAKLIKTILESCTCACSARHDNE